MGAINPAIDNRGRAVADREYKALTTGAGFRLLDERVVVKIRGEDRLSFMHGMCSNDVKNLPEGGVLYALFLTEHAHVIADFYAWAEEDAILIEAEHALWTRARAHLEKLLVADDVEMEELNAIAVIDVEGPASADALARIGPTIGASKVESWRFLKDGALMIANVPRLGLPAFTILVDRARVAETVSRLCGAIEVSAAALDTIRIENGIAKVGVDTGDKTIALEARLNSAISFSKGCYLGQETIERATARGGLKKRLFGLRFDETRLPEIDAAVYLSAREVGRVSSAAFSPRLGPLALSILHHSAWTIGTAVEVKDRSGRLRAVVNDLPFK